MSRWDAHDMPEAALPDVIVCIAVAPARRRLDAECRGEAALLAARQGVRAVEEYFDNNPHVTVRVYRTSPMGTGTSGTTKGSGPAHRAPLSQDGG